MSQSAYDCTVLLVEDNEIIGELMVRRLQRMFTRCVWGKSGEEGLKLFHAEAPAVILVDQLLPGMLGSELVAEIRKLNTVVPILGITASSMGTEIEALELAGANRAISKPVSLEALRTFFTMTLGQ